MEEKKLLRPTPADYEKRAYYEEIISEQGMDSEVDDEYMEFLNRFEWGGELYMDGELCGLKNALGEVLLAPVFEDMKLLSQHDIEKGDRIVAQQNSKWGVVLADGVGTWLVQPEYDTIGYPNSLTYVCKNGKWGVLNLATFEFLIPLECDKIYADNGFMFINGVGVYEKDDRKGIVSSSGEFTGAIFDDVDCEPDEHVKVLLNGEWGYINEGNEFTSDLEEAYYFSEM